MELRDRNVDESIDDYERYLCEFYNNDSAFIYDDRFDMVFPRAPYPHEQNDISKYNEYLSWFKENEDTILSVSREKYANKEPDISEEKAEFIIADDTDASSLPESEAETFQVTNVADVPKGWRNRNWSKVLTLILTLILGGTILYNSNLSTHNINNIPVSSMASCGVNRLVSGNNLVSGADIDLSSSGVSTTDTISSSSDVSTTDTISSSSDVSATDALPDDIALGSKIALSEGTKLYSNSYTSDASGCIDSDMSADNNYVISAVVVELNGERYDFNYFDCNNVKKNNEQIEEMNKELAKLLGTEGAVISKIHVCNENDGYIGWVNFSDFQNSMENPDDIDFSLGRGGK